MKNKGLLIAIAVLAVLGGAVYWSDKKKAEDEKHPPVSADAPPKILTIPEEQVQTVRLEKRGSEPVQLTRASGKWELTEPKPLPADQDAANGIVQNLTALSADQLIEAKSTKLDAYGLSVPSEQIVVTRKDGKKDTVLLGDDIPTGGGAYAKLASDPRIFTVATFVKTGLDKSLVDLRDKRLLHFNSDKLTRVSIASKSGSFEFGKNGQNEWQIVKPSALRADGQQVDELIRKLKEARMDPNAGLNPAEVPEGAKAAAKLATVTTSDSSGSESLDVLKGKEKDYYAKSSTVEGVYKIPVELGEAVTKNVEEYRNKKLFDFAFSDPTQVAVGAQVFQKSGEKWLSGGGQMDSSAVQSLIDKLRDLTATGFAPKPAGDTFLALSATSDNNKRVERITLLKQGADYFATRENEPSVYRLDAKSIEDIQKAAAAVRPFSAPKPPGKK